MRSYVAVIAAVILVGAGAWYLSSSPPSSGPPEPMTIGTGPVELAGLIYIAEDRGFFLRNGLDVTIREYDSALAAVAGMEAGEADLSASTEYPIVGDVLGAKSISIIGCIDRYQTTYLVGMNDRGIRTTSDLAGKRIGVHHESIGEFYLGRFLGLNGVRLGDVTLVDLSPAQIEGALAHGTIDAAIIWNLDRQTIQQRFGSTAAAGPARAPQPTFGVLAGRNDWIDGHGTAIAQCLRSIGEAEEYAVGHPAEARAIVQRRLNATDAHMAEAWPDHRFALSLDQSLLTAMEDEGRWMIANNLTNATAVRDLRDHLYTDGVEAVRPGSAKIIG